MSGSLNIAMMNFFAAHHFVISANFHTGAQVVTIHGIMGKDAPDSHGGSRFPALSPIRFINFPAALYE